jgi:hypothetical protein
VADLDIGAFVLVTVVEALTHAAVLRRPDTLRDICERRTGKEEEAQYSEERAVRVIPPPVFTFTQS